MIENVITSFLAFVSTNIDDIFILMIFYASQKYRASHIVAGQYLGISVLVMIGLVGSYIGGFVDARYIGLLGLFPIYLGIKHAYTSIKKQPEKNSQDVELSKNKTDIVAIATVTFANGGDNIGIYVPLLTTFGYKEKIGFCIVFTVMVFPWCALAKYLANYPLMAGALRKYAHIIMPLVLIFLGLFIIIESETLSIFSRLSK